MENNTSFEGPIEKNSIKVEQKSKRAEIWDIVKFAVIALIIVVPIRAVVAKPFLVDGSSMVPTFEDKNYLIVDEITYRVSDPVRGDVVVFHPPQQESVYYIKRIIGLPGETIEINNGRVVIKNETHKEGFTLNEPYISETGNTTTKYTLGDEQYFVMGDNRPYSSDSRYFGPLGRDNIKGRALLRLFPVGDIGIFPGVYHDYELKAE